jgi:hypothetical protein
MPAFFRRRWFQFRLRSLMAFVVVICLGLGGWDLLMTYGQYVEAEPAVVGQPIKVHGRFFHLFGRDRPGHYWFEVLKDGRFAGYRQRAYASHVGFGRFDFVTEIDTQNVLTHKVGEYTLRLTPRGRSPIHGMLVVRPAE